MAHFVRQNESSLLVVACAAAASLFIWVMFFSAAIDVGGHGEPVVEYELVQHIVQPGETLWGIAQVYRPGEDPRKVVYEIQEINGIGGALIREYQLVVVPVVRGER